MSTIRNTFKILLIVIDKAIFAFGALMLALFVLVCIFGIWDAYNFEYDDPKFEIAQGQDLEICKLVLNDKINYINTEAISIQHMQERFPSKKITGIARYHKSIDIYNNNTPVEFIEFEEYSGSACDISSHNIPKIDTGPKCNTGLRFFEHDNKVYATIMSWPGRNYDLHSVIIWKDNNRTAQTICTFKEITQEQ